MPKYKKGDKVKVSLQSHSPYRGYTGVVDQNPEKYFPVPKKASGYWYLVRFEKSGLHPAARFLEEELEAAA